MYLILSVFAVFVVLLINEVGWRKGWLHGELKRKFVHVIVGSFVAFWPFFLSWTEIRLLSVAFLLVVLISERLRLFKAIHSVQRPSYGEICFALIVGVLTLVTQSKAVYAAALLQMSLADGFAALVGVRFGKSNSYKVFGHTKSVAGTLTFLAVSCVLLLGYGLFSSHSLPVALAFSGSIIAGVIENLAPLGLDNLLVPLFIGLLLSF
jgi:phytol kinase